MTSNRTRSRILLGSALLILTFITYSRGIGIRPLSADERAIEEQGLVLAELGGHDADGRRLPLFVRAGEILWLQPLPVYATAALVNMIPSAGHARWTAISFGAAGVLLLYLLATDCCRSDTVGVAAALLLLLTPSYVTSSRMAAIEGVWQIPLLLGWALGVMALRERPSRPSSLRLAAGMLALAAALYTEPSAALIVPIFVLVTLTAIWRAPGWRARDWIAAGVAFSFGLLPLLIWYARFPRTYQDTFGRWLVHPANLRYPIEGFRAMTNHRRVGDVVHLFWDFYSPSHLFFAADSPAFCGMLATILAIPIVVGAYFLVSADRRTAEPARLLIAAGCVGGPLAAAMFGQTRSDEFGLVFVPFAMLLAAYGTVTLWRTSRTLGRSLTVAGYLLAVIQGFLFFRRL